MTIGELFIQLGFKVDGADKLDAVDRGMTTAAIKAGKLTLGITAINTAFLVMIDTSMHAATMLRNFALSTGLSTDELQRWQHVAQVNGVSAQELTLAIKTLQNARTQFALGEPEAVGVWSLLGVNPLQDPFKVLTDLRAKVLGIKDVGVARNLLGKVGLEGMMPVLRSTNQEFEKWSQNFVRTQEQVRQLAKLTAAWQSLKMGVESVKDQFSVVFVPVLENLARAFEWVAEKTAIFVRWLREGGPVAAIVRWALESLAALMLLLGGALVVVTAALVALNVALGVFTALAWGSGLAEIILALTAIAGIIAGIVLLADDMWNAITGKDSVTGRLGVKLLGPLFQGVKDAWDASEANRKHAMDHTEPLSDILKRNFAPGAAAVANSSVQHITINQSINGAGDPKATGRAIVDSFTKEIQNAARQAPVTSR